MSSLYRGNRNFSKHPRHILILNYYPKGEQDRKDVDFGTRKLSSLPGAGHTQLEDTTIGAPTIASSPSEPNAIPHLGSKSSKEWKPKQKTSSWRKIADSPKAKVYHFRHGITGDFDLQLRLSS